MATLLGSLLVSLGLESGEFRSGLSQAEKELRSAQKRFENIGKGMADLGAKMSLAVTLPLVAFGKQAVEAALGSRDAMAQVEKAIQSMGNAAGRTSKQLADLASEQMHNSLFDDDDILRKVTANLLTFGNVTADVFDRAQQAAIDLSARLNQDLQSSAIQVGKALNDPIKGVTALQRVGVSFTEQQKDQIKTMVATGKGMDAQRLILSELEKQFGGAAAAAADANPFAKLKHSIDDFQEAVGGVLLQILPPITDALNRLLAAFNNLSPGMQDLIVKGGLIAAALGPVLFVFGSLTQAIAPALAAFQVIGGYMASTGTIAGAAKVGVAALGGALSALAPAIPIIAGVAAAGYVLYTNWDKVAPVLQDFWNAAKEALGPPIQALITTLSSLLSELWNGPLGQAVRDVIALQATLFATFVKTLGPVLIQMIRIALLALTEFFSAIETGLRSISALLKGDWQSAWQIATGGATSALQIIRDRVLDLMGPIGMVIKALIRLGKLAPETVNAKSSGVAGALSKLSAANAAAGKGTPAATPTFSVPASGGSKSRASRGPKGRSADEIAADQAREIERLGMEELRSKLDLATSAEERADISFQILAAEKQQRLNEIDANKDFSADQKTAQKAYIERLYGPDTISGDINVTNDAFYLKKLTRDIAEQEVQLANDMLSRQADTLEAWADIEPSTKERARLETEALKLHQQIERNLLDQAIASGEVADAEQAQALLAQQQAAARERLRLQNMSPGERYAYDIQTVTANMNDALEQIEVNGLQAFNDGLTDAIVNFRSLGDVARSVIQQILSDLIRLQIQKSIIGPLNQLLGFGASAVGSGGLDVSGGPITGIDTSGTISGIPGFANGTSFAPGGLAWVGERGKELVNLPRGAQVIPNSELNGIGGRTEIHRPTFNFPGITTAREAREAAGQAARRYRREMNGPVSAA